jgi:TonB family protein
MRNAALERDDSILPFSFLVSLLAHGVILFLIVFPRAAGKAEVEHIFASTIQYQVFPEAQNFLRFSATDRIYTASASGLTVPTSGNIRIEPERLREEPRRELALRGVPNPEEIRPVENRIHYGDRSREEAASAAAAGGTPQRDRAAYRAAVEAPEGPEGIVQSFDPRFTSQPGAAERPQPGGSAAALRSGAEPQPTTAASATDGGRSQQIVDVPGQPLALPPTVPRSGQTQEHQAYTDPISTGPNVVSDLLEAPRPSGTVAPPAAGITVGARRLLNQPLPQYPEWAERDNIQATPEFHITIGSDGRVSRVRLSRTSGYLELDRLAEASVRRWIYEPRPGMPEERLARVRFVLRHQ